MQPPHQKRVCEEANGPTSAAPEGTTMFQKGQCVHDGGLETLEKTANSGLYNLFDKAGEHAIHFVNSFSALWTGKEGGSGVERGVRCRLEQDSV